MSEFSRVRLARRNPARAALLLSTAIGMAGVSHAQTVVVDQAADITYTNSGTIAGTPRAISLRSNGAVTATIGSVTGSSVAGNSPDGEDSDLIRMENEGTNALTATIGTITSTGTGDVYAFNASSDAGDIGITVGAIDLAGNATVGVLAESNTGNILINSTSIYTRGPSLNGKDVSGDALVGITDGLVTIHSGAARSDSIYGSAIVALSGRGATITSTSARTTGNQGAAIIANATAGDARVTSGTVDTSGLNAAGIGSVAAGSVIISSGTVTATGANSTGIGAQGAQGVAINASTTTSAGRAIGASSSGGNVLIVTAGDTIARTTGAAIGVSGGNISISTAASTTTSAVNANAIGFNARNDATINTLGTVTSSAPVTTGGTISGVALGTISIASNITANTGNGAAIFASAGTGVTVNATTVSAAAALQNAVLATTTAGNANVTVGTFTGSAALNAISANALNGIALVTAGNIANGNAANTAAGILANGRTGATINAGTIDAAGRAINAVSAAGNVTVATTGNITSRASNAINVSGASIDITTATGTTITANAGIAAIAGTATAGNASVTNNGSIVARAGTESGIGITARDNIIIVSNVISVQGTNVPTSGLNAAGISAVSTGGGTVSVVSQTVTVDGPARDGIYVSSAGLVNIASVLASTTAADRAAINVSGGTGAVTVKSGTSIASGDGAPAILVQTASGNIDIASTTASALGLGYANFTSDAIVGISDAGMVKIVSGSTRSDGQFGSAITAMGGAGVDVTSTSALINGNGGVGIGVSSSRGNAVLNSGSLVFNGTSGAGISVVSTVGTANAVIDTVTAMGGTNIFGVGVSGALGATVTAGTIASSGTGLSVFGGSGGAVINSGSVATTGAGASGVVGRATTGSVTINSSGTITTVGAGRTAGGRTQYADGILAISESGSVTVTNAANITTTGIFGSAIAVESGTGITSFTTTTPLGAGQIAIVNTGTLQTAGGSAVFIRSGNSATSVTNAGTITTTGAAGSAISIQAGDGARMVLNSGTITTSGTTGAGATILVGAGAVSATNTGTIMTAAAGADGLRFFQSTNATTSGLVTVNNGGIIAVTTAAGLNLASALSSFIVTNTGSITGGQAGILQTGGTAAIINSGTIAGTTGAAIATSGTTSLINSGTIRGTGATAVLLGGADDSVELLTGSSVDGIIDFGAGNDQLVLNGTSATASIPTQIVTANANLETMNVATGYWTANSATSMVGAINIAAGASLELVGVSVPGASGATFVNPLRSGAVVNTGSLVFNSSTGLAGNVAELAVSGTGGIRFIGTDTVAITTPNLAHTGATTVENGTVILTSTLLGDVVTSGNGIFRLGDGNASGSLQGNLINNGTFFYDRSDSYTLDGNFTGTGLFTKLGAGTLTIGGIYGFTGTTNIVGGRVAFAGVLSPSTELDLTSGTVDLSGATSGSQTVAELGGTGGSLELGTTNLTVNQTTSTSFAGSVNGTGGLTKTGAGTLDLTGTSSYTGVTAVSGGVLKVNGSIANSTVVLGSGGTLGGNGTVGGLLGQGGTLSPGNSIGRLTVNGNIVLNAASVYAVEANALGQADRVDATGTATLGGATVAVAAASGLYRPTTAYTILTAAGGISGTFGAVTSNLAFLTPSLSYSGTAVSLTLTRNNIAFASAGRTPNERAVGGAIQALGAGNALFEAALTLVDSGVSPAFGALAGQINGAIGSGLIEATHSVRSTIGDVSVAEGRGVFGWGNVMGTFQRFQSTASTERLDSDGAGVIGGFGYGVDGLLVGIGGGYTAPTYRGAGARVRSDTPMVAGFAGYARNGIDLKLGGSVAWSNIRTRRNVTIGSIGDTLTGRADATTAQIFAQARYAIPVGNLIAAPVAGIAYAHTGIDAFTETGGPTALDVSKVSRGVTYSTLGIGLSGASGSLRPVANIAWRHGWGDLAGLDTVGFVGSPGRFVVAGAGIVEDAADISAGLDYTTGRLRLSASASGVIGRDYTSVNAKLAAALRF